MNKPIEGSQQCGPPPTTMFDAEVKKCSNLPPPVKRCPEGNRAERTKPIYPKQNVFPKGQSAKWTTTYQQEFIVRQGGRPPLVGPPVTPWRTEKQFYWDSVYRSEYKPFCPEKKVEKERGFHYSPPCQPMNAQSTYNRDYPKKIGLPAKTAKKKFFYDPHPPLMDDQSSYKLAFVHHQKPARDCKKTQKELQVEFGSHCLPFEGITTYKKDYTPVYKSCQSKSMRPKVFANKPLGKFDDRTVYRCAYEPFYYDDGQYENCVPYLMYKNMYPPPNPCTSTNT